MGGAFCARCMLGPYGLRSVGTAEELRQYVACFMTTAVFDKHSATEGCKLSCKLT
jgi:hypothetical protein